MSVEMRRVATTHMYLIREGRRWSVMSATRAALFTESRNLRRDLIVARRHPSPRGVHPTLTGGLR